MNRKTIKESPKKLKKGEHPFVTLILPAFNEGKTIANSIESLLKINYPKDKYEIIVANDGSSDNTASEVEKYLSVPNLTFINNTVNKGKAAVMNQSIKRSKGEFVACMDTDSELLPDTLEKVVPYFQDSQVAAATVRVDLKNTKTFLEKVLNIEYLLGLFLGLKALSYFDALHVTPGPFSVYRKSAIEKIGLYDTTSLVEDLEIAYRIQKAGYRIVFCGAASVRTITPNTLGALYKQRKRWYTGSLQTLWKHKGLILNPKVGMFGVTMPYTYLLITLGLGLFGYTLVLTGGNLLDSIIQFSYTGFNFFSHMTFEFDFLKIGILSLLGFSAFCATIFSAFFLLFLGKITIKDKLIGIIGFVYLYFLYQVFWASSFYSAIVGKKVKWR